MPEITLKEIAHIARGTLHGNGDLRISTLETDSRKMSAGEAGIFIAIKGDRHDGHAYIEPLYKSGMRHFMIDDKTFPVSKLRDADFVITTNTTEALQLLAAWQRNNLNMPVIAVTGSNGKTIVKEWLFQCLSHSGSVSRSPKSFNSQIGVPLSIWMLDEKSDWAIVEAGISMPGEMKKLESMIRPDFGIITNIGQAHQENFKSLKQKVNEKIQLFKHTPTLYYCRDHEIIHQALTGDTNFSDKQLISWSYTYNDCFMQVTEVMKSDAVTSLSLVVEDKTVKITIPFSDDASLENCLHIIAFLFHNKFKSDTINNAIRQLAPVGMRLEQIQGIGNSTIINDSYNSDINSLKIALDFLAIQKQHKKHALILSDIRQSGLKPEELYSDVIRLIRSYKLDQLIVIGSDITSCSQLPSYCIKFHTTDEFLQSLPLYNFSDHAVLIKGARNFCFEKIVKALSEKKHTTILEINLNNLISNLNHFRGLIKKPTKIMVMVKALSYGSGSFEIANLLQHERVDYLGVAFADEGIALRNAGISLPIMVMSPSDESFEEIIEYGLEPEIFNLHSLQQLAKVLSSAQLKEYPVHIKLDTGMHRLGFLPEEMNELLAGLSQCPDIRVKAVFSHLAVSDNPAEDQFTHQQIKLFEKMVGQLAEHLHYMPMRHMMNSAGIERFPEAHFDMVRLGIGLHGISSVDTKLKPVSTLKTRISQIKNLSSTETVGYNRRGILTTDSRIAIIPIGYADGLNRKLGNRTGYTIVNNHKAYYIGDICMDMCMIDVTDIPAKEGDEVIIFGAENSISNLARQISTIPYEILTNVSSRVKRIYTNE